MLTVNRLLICRRAEVTEDGTLNAFGVLPLRVALELPYILPAVSVILDITGSVSPEHDISIAIRPPKAPVREGIFTMRLPPGALGPDSLCFTIDLGEYTFEEPGNHAFEIRLKRRTIYTQVLYVMKA